MLKNLFVGWWCCCCRQFVAVSQSLSLLLFATILLVGLCRLRYTLSLSHWLLCCRIVCWLWIMLHTSFGYTLRLSTKCEQFFFFARLLWISVCVCGEFLAIAIHWRMYGRLAFWRHHKLNRIVFLFIRAFLSTIRSRVYFNWCSVKNMHVKWTSWSTSLFASSDDELK